MIFGLLLGWYTIYIQFWGLLAPDGILARAKFTLRPSLAFSYIGNVTARHSSSGPQPNFAAWYKEWNYGTLADGATYIRLSGHHVGHQPTFLVSSVLLTVNAYSCGCVSLDLVVKSLDGATMCAAGASSSVTRWRQRALYAAEQCIERLI